MHNQIILVHRDNQKFLKKIGKISLKTKLYP